jgi:hypothetical protein
MISRHYKAFDKINRIDMIFFAFPEERQKVQSLFEGGIQYRSMKSYMPWNPVATLLGIILFCTQVLNSFRTVLKVARPVLKAG